MPLFGPNVACGGWMLWGWAKRVLILHRSTIALSWVEVVIVHSLFGIIILSVLWPVKWEIDWVLSYLTCFEYFGITSVYFLWPQVPFRVVSGGWVPFLAVVAPGQECQLGCLAKVGGWASWPVVRCPHTFWGGRGGSSQQLRVGRGVHHCQF